MALKEQANKHKAPRNRNNRLQDGKPLEHWADWKKFKLKQEHWEVE